MLRLESVSVERFDAAMGLIDQAKAHLKAQGVDQWQKGYPDADCIRRDIAAGKAYFLMEDASVAGYLCIDFDGEPAYRELVGEWKTPEPYAVVHRLAISDACKGRGLAGAAFALTEELCRERGVPGIRVDTDEANLAMQRVLKRMGFVYCGKIWFDNSEKIAFDKVIQMKKEPA